MRVEDREWIGRSRTQICRASALYGEAALSVEWRYSFEMNQRTRKCAPLNNVRSRNETRGKRGKGKERKTETQQAVKKQKNICMYMEYDCWQRDRKMGKTGVGRGNNNILFFKYEYVSTGSTMNMGRMKKLERSVGFVQFCVTVNTYNGARRWNSFKEVWFLRQSGLIVCDCASPCLNNCWLRNREEKYEKRARGGQ